jgi:predicted aldo/keto reductase-like oxidoreductase
MQYTILGKTGLRVSRVGLGGIPVQRIDEQGTIALVDELIKQGVNFIDSARGYTVSEAYLGAALAGRRDKFILASKSMARNYQAMKRDIDISLDNFRTDHIELYQLHNLSVAEISAVMEEGGAASAILDAKAEGKVGHLGATAHSPEAFARLLEYPQIETIMFPYNLVENQGQEYLRLSRQKGIGFIAMKPLAGGNIDNARLAMRYLLLDADCDIIIPGMARAAEVAENTAVVADTSPLTAEEQAEIAQIRERLADNFCRRCGYCAPCSEGIDIAACFTMANYLDKYDLADWAKERYQNYQAHASDCISCGLCEQRCPYQLPIRQKLREIKDLFGI